jgi:hypothetical protein
MTTRRVALASAWLALSALLAGPAAGKGDSVGDWRVTAGFDGGHVAYTLSRQDADVGFLVIFDPSEACAPYYVLVLNDVATKSGVYRNSGLRLRFRVDRRALYTVNAPRSVAQDSMLMFPLQYVESADWIRDLAEGATLRVEMSSDADGDARPAYASFSLVGSTVALQTAHSICRDALSDSDEGYFADDPVPEPRGHLRPAEGGEYFRM